MKVQPPPPQAQLARRSLPGRVPGAIGLLIALPALFGACAFPGQLNQNAGKTIRYEVTGDSGVAQNVTYQVTGGQQQDTQVSLPWSKEFTAGTGFQAFVVTAQNAGSGSISCDIAVDGKIISQQTSNGQYAVVTCSGS